MSTNGIEVIISVSKGATNIEATYKRGGREYVTSNGLVGEIVRCKDCKHWQPQEYGVVEVPFCKYLGEREEIGLDIKLGNPDDFCSYGERSSDDKEDRTL